MTPNHDDQQVPAGDLAQLADPAARRQVRHAALRLVELNMLNHPEATRAEYLSLLPKTYADAVHLVVASTAVTASLLRKMDPEGFELARIELGLEWDARDAEEADDDQH